MTLSIEIEAIDHSNAPQIFKKDGLASFLDHIREQVSGEVPDIETAAGRKRIKSLAAQVSRSKTAVEKPGREYLKEIKALPKVVEAELREFVRACDALKEEVRKPLTDWENAEKERVTDIEAKISNIKHAKAISHDNSVQARKALEDLLAIVIDDSFAEFKADAALAKDEAITVLNGHIEFLTKQEEQAAEQLRLQKEAQAKAKAERDERLKREAKEQAEREHKEAIERANREKEEAEKRAIEAEAKAKRDAEEKLAQQQREAEQAKLKAEQAEAETRARIEREAKQKAEQEAAEQVRVEAEEKQRKANVEHRKQINNAIVNALVESAGLTLLDARNTVKVLAQGKVPNVEVKY
ncbi:hypothetical protein [Gayadomonas joobiniege]|uniref:hypothetical protein n=1 Tax=Gayadomonas joobiniege TaxID=1234606 RepID=UPI000366AB42|nr:hypothetical protein [Gayadomonas joobiniege]